MNTTRYLNQPEGRIAWDLAGPAEGELVVCIPSMGDLRSEYRALVPLLVAQGYRVATVDVRGHGESDTSFTDYSAAAIGADVVALIDSLEVSRAHILGESMGAAAAVWAAAERPAIIQRLVLLGAFVRDLPMPWLMRVLLKFMFMRPWGAVMWGLYYRMLYPTRPPADLAAHRAALTANLRQPRRLEALQAMLGASKAPCAARLPEVRARTLVVMGSKDPDFPNPRVEAEFISAQLQGETFMVDGSGHYPHAEMPEIVVPRIAAFLALSLRS